MRAHYHRCEVGNHEFECEGLYCKRRYDKTCETCLEDLKPKEHECDANCYHCKEARY